MDRSRILLKDPSDWTEEEQLFIIQQTDNSLKTEDEELEQPEQRADYKPDPDEVITSIDAEL